MSKYKMKEIKEAIQDIIKLSQTDIEVHGLLVELLNIASKTFPNSSKAIESEHDAEVDINPISIFTEAGEDGLLKALEPLTLVELIDIIKKFGFDPSRKSYRWRKKERLVDFIIQRIKSSTSRGDVFRK